MTRILVVDDDPQSRSMMDLMLSEESYQVAQAHSGEQALRMVQEQDHHPDLILLDIIMPGLSGYDVAERLKDDPATAAIPIIFVTAQSEPEDLARSWGLAVDYICKPFAELRLLACVRNVLQLREMEKTLRQRGRESPQV